MSSQGGGRGSNRWYYVVLMEGRNREVRRLWDAVGFEVSRLIRVGYGPIQLPRKLHQGKHEPLTERQVIELYKAARLEPPVSVSRPPRASPKKTRNPYRKQ